MMRSTFFIVGAPKCGTSSLADWLSAHPDVFVSPFKEPHYYAHDLHGRQVSTRAAYERLFRKLDPKHRASGEASTWYLYSRTAVPEILNEHPRARLIVCLRNPVDMASSLHDQYLRAGVEDLTDLATAWRLEPSRAAGAHLPAGCKDPQMLQYSRICALGEQLDRLYDAADPEQILPVLLDDLRASPEATYGRVLTFIDVPPDGRTSFPTINSSSASRSPRLGTLLRGASRFRAALRLPAPGTGLSARLERMNRRPRPRPPLDPELRQELCETFRPEIESIEHRLGRDLSHWKV